MKINTFYSVVVLKPTLIETKIVKEKHFPTLDKANSFACKVKEGFTAVVFEMN